VSFEEMEAALRARLGALAPAARAELIHIVRLPDLERVERIESGGHPTTRSFGTLLIDLEEEQGTQARGVRGSETV
jgi:hypothetical protein